MLRSVCQLLALATPLLLALPGCGSGQRQWEVAVENRADVPCSFFVTLGADGTSNAKVEDVVKGKTISLVAGTGKTVVQKVRVVRGKDEQTRDEQTLSPKVELPAGKRYTITVGAEGQIEASISNR